ncbi:PLC-like phosphodiesterase [Trichocladium antarcticum]|uniref:PLC-like phosphodiesterase n=1 Tax=Trichocladium antarcticum TaxID=1450529 RepID=A0AAN6UMK7_9PEZI|nr:PLC-like phosphodiesterase [Trichocladium antarcticum]
MRWMLMEPEYAATTGRTYITIVNLTPHPFVLTSTHQYQMSDWDWDTVPPGKSRQNVAEHTGKVGANPIDTNGEAYYRIGDTGKTFVVRATTHIPDTYPRRVVFDLSGMGKGQREYKVPEQEVPVTLVITGSDEYGFVTSLSHGPGNWMNSIKDVIQDRPLRHVVMPGTHDSGMSKISGAILTGATSGNTQTQGLNMYNQLRTGARWFDLRVQTVHQVAPSCCDNYEFWTTHINDETADAPIGRSGEKFDDVVDNINQFTAENPGEVIILQFRYLIGIRNVPSMGPEYWKTKQKDEFFDKLRRINNRCGNIPTSGANGLGDRGVGSFMSSNGNKGCVLIFLDTRHLEQNIAAADRVARADGIYHKNDLPWSDGWPNKEDTKDVAESNINRWQAERTNVLVSQWLSTPNFMTSTFVYSLQSIAVLPTNPTLYWRGVPEMSPTAFPNVIMVDYVGQILMNERAWDELGAELYTLAVGLNLYMLSENCDISPKRSVLLPKRSGSGSGSARIAAAPQANPLVSSWNGIIFANGTTVNNPPPALRLGQPAILRGGTVFSNGTVLTKDIPNPEYKGASARV